MNRTFVFTLLTAASVDAALNQPVRTESGQVAGIPGTDRSITVFKGIPFAAPPVGNLRWAAPEAPVKWQGVRAGDRFGANCIQTIVEEKKPWTREFMAHGDVSEDCLFLNIWTAAASPDERRPVLVFLHGGANTEGSGSIDGYNGEGLARKGVIMVTINYRLGVFGFFTHGDLNGNYALLDQMAALKWVKRNIAAFGGDPTRVTVAGQSAGASDIALLMQSPLAVGLFQRAIMESGGAPGNGGARPLETAKADGVKFAEAKGAHSVAELRAMPWQQIFSPVAGVRFGPVVDGSVIVSAPHESIDCPVLTGSNADENGAKPGADEKANQEAREKQRVRYEEWAAQRGLTAKAPVYLYMYNHVLPGPDAGKYGAFHTSEIPYVLNSLAMSDRPFAEEDRRVAETLSSYWANFAANGNPNGSGLPHWPSAQEEPHKVMEIGGR